MNRHCPICKSENLEERMDGTVEEYPNITRLIRCQCCGFSWKIRPAQYRTWSAKYIENDRASTNDKED